MSHKPWEHAKSSGSEADPLAVSFVESLSFDTRLYDADIRGSLAHAHMLRQVGLLTEEDLLAIQRALAVIRQEIESAPAGPTAVSTAGAWRGWKTELEDVHMCIEAALVEKIGDAGRRLHTGRSRNDQVALDLRLWVRDAASSVRTLLADLVEQFAALARRQGDLVLPTYTHLQRAQPGCVGAECMAWCAMFERASAFLADLAAQPLGLGACPLGGGAVAGSALPLDRALTARDLHFHAPAMSSIDATASRDEALDFVYALSRIALALSRWAEQWIIYSTTEFSFILLDEAHTTGSSMMPQKRNPDMLELIRGRAGGVVGSLTSLCMILKGLPLAYNRDLQEDKRHVFAAYDSASLCLRIAARIVAGASFREDRLAEFTESGGEEGVGGGHLDATSLAEYLVVRGIPFRTAHQAVGAMVRAADESGRTLSQLPPVRMNEALAALGVQTKVGADVQEWLGPARVAARYQSLGHAGTGPGGYKDWLQRRDQSAAAAPAATQQSLFAVDPPDSPPTPAAEAAIIDAYARSPRTLDDLPYTEDFQRLLDSVRAVDPGAQARSLFHRLHNLRKAGRLPKKPDAAPVAGVVRVEPHEEALLTRAVIEHAGSLGQRDRLLFTPQFDQIVERFNADTGRALDPHAVWRLVARLAK